MRHPVGTSCVDTFGRACANDRVKIRRAATAVTTLIVAFVVALAVPVSQLRLVTTIAECCCPDPSNCHCPHQQADHSTRPSVRPCHRTSHDVVSPQAPAFTAPAVVVADELRPTLRVATELATTPRAAPEPARPDAPS